MSKDWSIDEFERLAARITQQIEAYKYSLLYSNVPLAPIFRVSSLSLVTKHFTFDDKHDKTFPEERAETFVKCFINTQHVIIALQTFAAIRRLSLEMRKGTKKRVKMREQ